MKKFLLILLILTTGILAIYGCTQGGEVDKNTSSDDISDSNQNQNNENNESGDNINNNIENNSENDISSQENILTDGADIVSVSLNGENLTVQPQNYRANDVTTINNPDGEIYAEFKNLTISGKTDIGANIILGLTAKNPETEFLFYSDKALTQELDANNLGTVKAGENLIYINSQDKASGKSQIYTLSLMGLGDSESDAKYYEYAEPTIIVSDLNSLRLAMETAESGQVIGIAGGDYFVYSSQYNRKLQFYNKHDVTLRSVSGNYENVILHGSGFHKEGGYRNVQHNEMLTIIGGSSGVTFYGITLRDSNANGFKLEGTNERDIMIDNCRAIDVCERMVKGAAGGGAEMFTYNLTIKNSWFENTQLPYSGQDEDHTIGLGTYIAGLDIMNLHGALIQNNVFKNIQGKTPDGEFDSNGAMYFWGDGGSADIIVENNFIFNCDRGIIYGLSGRGVDKGIIRNNIIYGVACDAIHLDSTKDIEVYNNTVVMNKRNRFNRGIRDVESRSERLIIKNNIAHEFQGIENGENGNIVENNLLLKDISVPNYFTNGRSPETAEDFMLTDKAVNALGQGIALPGLVDEDFFGNGRGDVFDIGAHQFTN